MREAVATSMLVITMNTTSGFIGHMSHLRLDLLASGVVTAGAITGVL
ncbi:MAG: hypothetical protein R3C68_18675 [Myxococcota bacterium]